MTCKKLQRNTQQTNLKNIAIFAAIFVVSFALFYTPKAIEATCGINTKYNASGFLGEAGDRWGNQANIKINSVTICGTDTYNSYAHITNGGLSSGTGSGSDYIEAGIWKGYQGTASTGSNLHYNMIVKNFYNGGKKFYDLTVTNGNKIPSLGQNVNVKLNWKEYRDLKDWYTVTITNTAAGHTIIADNVHVNGRGTAMLTQAEKLNQSSEIRGTSTTIKDYSTSLAWSDWTISSGSIAPTTSDNTMCFVKNAANSYSFGVKSGTSCLTS